MLEHLRRWIAPLFVAALLLVPVAAWGQAVVNINSAGMADLTTLPGIGNAKAQAIIDYRDTNGPFTDINQITNVPGIGDATFANISSLITVDGEGGGPAPAAGVVEDDGDGDTPPAAAAPAGAGGLINVNTADSATLQTLPGIGPAKAEAIIQYRTDNGPFQSVEDLDNVTGIGPATLGNIRALVTVE